jgi:hypothetical protein
MLSLTTFVSVAVVESAIVGGAQVAMTTKLDKNGNIKTGSFARAFAFASREARHDVSRAIYAKFLSNGTYRPIVQDLIDVLVPKSAQPFLSAVVAPVGPVNKEALIALCRAVKASVDSSGKEPKGQKLFFYGLASAIVSEYENQQTVIDQQ